MNDEQVRDTLQELYEQAPCGYIFMLPDGTIVRANQTFLDMTGYSQDELVSSTRFQDLLSVPGKIFYENQYAPLLQMQGFVKAVAFDLVCKGGARLPVLVNSVQRSDADGRPLLTASTIFDATDRRVYEQELLIARQKAEQLAAIVSSSSDAILSASPQGVIETWNNGAERLFGYPAEEIVGRSLRDILAPADGEAEWHRIDGELRAGRAVELETFGLQAAGRRIDVSVVLTPQVGLLGELSGMSLVIRDISERRALERLQREFLAMVSHELRNPVAAIRGYAQLMRRRASYSEQGVETIVVQADQLARLIDDLLLASQIESDRLDLRLVETDLVAEARAAAEHLRAQRASIRVETPPEPLPILADRQRLGQVLANLLTNAIKYSPDDSEILVRVGQQADEAYVAVADQGIGIPPEALPRLFERFFRVAGAAERARGIGLGLYISGQIVESHGGRISVDSEPGRGSTFTVSLPIYTRPGSSSS